MIFVSATQFHGFSIASRRFQQGEGPSGGFQQGKGPRRGLLQALKLRESSMTALMGQDNGKSFTVYNIHVASTSGRYLTLAKRYRCR